MDDKRIEALRVRLRGNLDSANSIPARGIPIHSVIYLYSDELADLLVMINDYVAMQKRFDDFTAGVRQLIFDLQDAPSGTF